MCDLTECEIDIALRGTFVDEIRSIERLQEQLVVARDVQLLKNVLLYTWCCRGGEQTEIDIGIVHTQLTCIETAWRKEAGVGCDLPS